MLLGSTILGLEHHTPENIAGEIEHAISHETDLHQFMLYTPVPGTPLYQEMAEQGRLLDVDLADIHGQLGFNFQHAAISREESKKFLDWAFWRDFERNGPSLFRICRTTFEGWKRYKNHPDLRVRERFQREARVAPARLRRHALGHGIPSPRDQRFGGLADPHCCARTWNGNSGSSPPPPRACWVPSCRGPARREEKRLAAGQRLRTAHHHRAPQLAGKLETPAALALPP